MGKKDPPPSDNHSSNGRHAKKPGGTGDGSKPVDKQGDFKKPWKGKK